MDNDIRDGVQALIFGLGDDDDDAALPSEEGQQAEGEAVDPNLQWTRESAYIEVLERAIKGIKASKEESRLFTPVRGPILLPNNT